MFSVTLANGKQFLVKEGQTILEGAKDNSIAIAYSCRLGRCGACAVPLMSGETKVSIDEDSLSSSELSSGLILTCCRIPTSDICLDTIDLDGLSGLNAVTLPAKVDRITRLCKDVLEVILRFPENTKFKFTY